MTRRRAYRFGRFAESLCVWSLRLRGYRVLARRFAVAVGEIDIVAQRGATLAVIEVKARQRDDHRELLTVRLDRPDALAAVKYEH